MSAPQRIGIVAICLVLAAAGVRPAYADSAKASAYFERGTRLYQVGEYAQAIEQFKAGHIEEPDPSFIFNIAQCQRQLGQTKEALVSYKRFLTLDPDTAMRPDVERKITDLDAKLRKEAVAPPPGAAGYVQPSIVRPPQGSSGGQSETASPERSRWPLWVGGALTLAFAGGAVAVGLSSNARFDELKRTCGASMTCEQSVRDEMNRRALLVNVLAGLAGASAITTGIIFFTSSKESGVALSFAF